MKLTYKDILVLVIGTAVISTASFLLYRDFSQRISHTSGKSIGTITYKKKVAERKYSGEVMWEGVIQNTPVYDMDSIRTDIGSSALISLAGGTRIDLDENTFIILSLAGQDLAVDFTHGTIAVNAGKNTAVTVKADNKKIGIGGASLISEKTGKVSVNVTKGSARIGEGPSAQEITAGQTAVMSDKTTDVKKDDITVISPDPDTYHVTETGTTDVVWKWDTDSKTRLYLELSPTATFTSLVKKEGPLKSPAKIKLPAGNYYWRLISQDGSARISPRRLTILRSGRPKPVQPSPDETLAGENPSHEFRWTPSPSATGYSIEISSDKNFSSLAASGNTYDSRFYSGPLPDGEYYWRVIPGYDMLSQPVLLTSGIQKFTVKHSIPVTPVQLAFPPESHKYTVTTKKPVLFSWQDRPGSSFEFQCSSDPSFKTLVTSAETTGNYFRFYKTLPEGHYYWRVGIKSGEKPAVYSTVHSFTMNPASVIKPLSPASGENVLMKNGMITFSWDDPNAGENYIVEISTDKSFKTLTVSEDISGIRRAQIKMIEGTYYWRVVQVDSGKRILESEVSSLECHSGPGMPELESPQENHTIDISQVKNIEFRWKKSANAKAYEFTLSLRKDKKWKKIQSRIIKENRVVLANPRGLKKGTYQWEIRSLSGDKSIDNNTASASRSFTITTPKMKEIEIDIPETIYLE